MSINYEDFEWMLIVIVFGILGIVVAMIIYNLNVQGILVPEFLTGSITITQVMAGIIILFIIGGIVVAAIKK